jgi:hypothetical protein
VQSTELTGFYHCLNEPCCYSGIAPLKRASEVQSKIPALVETPPELKVSVRSAPAAPDHLEAGIA